VSGRRAAAALVLAAAVVGCGVVGGAGYLVRAGWAEARLLWRRQPIADLLARPDLPPALRERLVLTLAVRDFASESLGLRVGDSYTTFAEVERTATVYVLSAARRDRLEAHAWWYPLVGRLPYRGFFDEGAAEAAGEALAARDLDVEVRPAVAFSTLGWFADPLLSTAAAGSQVDLAETVLHELFHATLFVPGAAAFNESAATFAGQRGAAAFFCPGGPGADPGRCEEARRGWTVTRARGRVLGRLADRLRRLYAARPGRAVRERARAHLAAAAADDLVRRGLGTRAELVPPNNARLLGQLLYATALDDFDRLAPTDADMGPALAALGAAVRGERDPLRTVRALASRPEGR
jgi:predicted aminopeptidase